MIDQFGKMVYECDLQSWSNWYDELYVRSGKKRPIVPPWHKHLVEQWTGLPANLAKKLSCPDNLRADFEAEGLMRLCEISEKYNPRRAQFQTIAYLSLWRHLSRWLTVQYRSVASNDLDSAKKAVIDNRFGEIDQNDRLSFFRKRIAQVSQSANPVDMEIVNAYYGLDGKRPRTTSEIAKSKGVTKERVRQKLKRGLHTMRQAAVR